MRVLSKASLAALAAIGVAVIQAGPASAATDPFMVYPVWCGHWDPNPITASVVGETHTPMLDGSVGDIVWGTSGGSVYVWARLTNAPAGDRIALAWKDDRNATVYQCGDSHAYSTATVWSGTATTWTAGVPLTPPSAGDGPAQCVGLLVWRSNGALEYRAPQCLTPWIAGTTGAPPTPAPPPTPGPAPAPAPATPTAGQPGPMSIRLSLHGSRHSLRNGQVLRLRGRLLGTAVPVGLLVELQARVGRRHWITFAVAIAGPGGRFTYAYRFTRTTGRQTYWLRARLPTERAYSSSPATSRAIRVHVTGRT